MGNNELILLREKNAALERKLEIESSLERVRTVALSMNTREDMVLVCRIIAEQLALLDVKEIRNVQTAIFYEEKGTYMNYEYYAKHDKTFITETVYTNHEIARSFAAKMLKGRGEESITHINGEEKLKDWLAYQKGTNVFIDTFLETASSLHYYWFSLGPVALGISTYVELNDDELNLFKRFLNVFELAYRRYLDIEKATAQAREARIEAALEKVRASAMAMHNSHDISSTTNIVFAELKKLDIESKRCGVALLSKTSRTADVYAAASSSDGHFHTLRKSIEMTQHPSQVQQYESWLAQKNYISVLSGDELKSYYRLPFFYSSPSYTPPENYNHKEYGYYIPFSEGLFYAWTENPYSDDEMNILNRFKSIIDLTFRRFLDLQKAEAQAEQARLNLIQIQAEKKRAEEALKELQATQAQLIQSEKMASLGELTAGIAHEIQNPLNFVNNFSEVSNELINEMNIEIEKGDMEEARAIANDIKQNLEKINHHGKRADAIVKGMLQHSRTGSGQKEPTNINTLADEYLRLAYHGLRAKDKSFNASLKTDYDETIGLINIIPQDIGRVILNLITNAFYVVGEKKKSNIDQYEPIVSVSTKRIADTVEISVKDNGTGIPAKVLDKIFQPFFTTKPTGQGTGLGLSLAYDIIKAQGGELNVETMENEGTTFTITLPMV